MVATSPCPGTSVQKRAFQMTMRLGRPGLKSTQGGDFWEWIQKERSQKRGWGFPSAGERWGSGPATGPPPRLIWKDRCCSATPICTKKKRRAYMLCTKISLMRSETSVVFFLLISSLCACGCRKGLLMLMYALIVKQASLECYTLLLHWVEMEDFNVCFYFKICFNFCRKSESLSWNSTMWSSYVRYIYIYIYNNEVCAKAVFFFPLFFFSYFCCQVKMGTNAPVRNGNENQLLPMWLPGGWLSLKLKSTGFPTSL